tara:strand:+ start:35972 stop:36223 length:252 start_codon:yes stop_codon:yes gene_type:complete
MQQNRTPAGKQMGICKVANSSLWRIRWEEGGELPDGLEGQRFTSADYAQKEIEAYLKRRWDQEEEAAKKAERKRSGNGATSAG